MQNRTSYKSSPFVMVALLSLLPLFFCGCNSSINSLYQDDESNVVFDERLVGQWIAKVESEEAHLKFERIDKSNTYKLSAPEQPIPDEWSEMEARLVVIGENRILDFTNPNFTEPSRHYFFRIQLDENTLKFQPFNYDLIRKNPHLLPSHIDRLHVDASGIAVPLPLFVGDAGFTINATTKELQTFFVTHSKDETIWVEDSELPALERHVE